MTFVMKIYVIKILKNNFQILSGKIGRNFSHSGKISGRNIERNFCQIWKETAKFRQNWKEISFFLPLILHPEVSRPFVHPFVSDAVSRKPFITFF